jgi:hypothetical protein
MERDWFAACLYAQRKQLATPQSWRIIALFCEKASSLAGEATG